MIVRQFKFSLFINNKISMRPTHVFSVGGWNNSDYCILIFDSYCSDDVKTIYETSTLKKTKHQHRT
jgi:hypothetical protein